MGLVSCCWQCQTLPLFSSDSVVGSLGYLDMGPCTTPTRGGPLKAAMLMKDAGLGCNFPGHSGQAQDRGPVGHQGPGGGSRGPGTRRVRPLLQMGLPEDPASVEFLCQHSSCVILRITLFFKIVYTVQYLLLPAHLTFN